MRSKKTIAGLLFVFIFVLTFAFAACGDNLEKLKFESVDLPIATVGVEYTARIDTATGADSIKYELKAGSDFPLGFTLSPDGEIKGTPKYPSTVAFTVVATADGMEKAEALFKIVIKEPDNNTVKYEHNYFFEAENAESFDSASKQYGFDARNGGFIDFNSNGVVEFHIDSETNAEVNLSICLGTINAKGMKLTEVYDIFINDSATPLATDADVPRGNMLPPWDWHCWTDVSVGTISLKEGVNVIRFVGRQSENKTPLCLDYITLQTDDDDLSFSEVWDGKYYAEAENGKTSGEAESITGHRARGNAFVDFHGKSEDGAEDNAVEISLNVNKNAEVDLYVCLGIVTEGGYTLESVYTIMVNDEACTCNTEVPGGAADPWYTWTEINVGKIKLKEGLNIIKISGGDNARCLDYLLFTTEDTDLAITI